MLAITVKSIELAEIQKKVLAKKYVEIFSEITNVPKDRVYIFFDSHELDNVGTAGIRFLDNPGNAWSKFTEDEFNPGVVWQYLGKGKEMMVYHWNMADGSEVAMHTHDSEQFNISQRFRQKSILAKLWAGRRRRLPTMHELYRLVRSFIESDDCKIFFRRT